MPGRFDYCLERRDAQRRNESVRSPPEPCFLPPLAQLSRQQQGQRVRFTLLRTDRGYADIWRTSASSLLRLLEQCKIRSIAIASVALKTCHFMEQAPPDESPHHLASG
jgi:hypothetical protein